MEFGLCCLFADQPINFRTYTLAGLQKLSNQSGEQAVRDKILSVWDQNTESLRRAISFCAEQNIAGFRISSDLFPQISRMKNSGFVDQSDIEKALKKLSSIDSKGRILSLHPGQHVNLGSPTDSVIENSLIDLNEHFAIADAMGAGEINIHLGGAYGDKRLAQERFIDRVRSIPDHHRTLITLENDELTYSIDEVIDTAQQLSLRVVYDIHHQRCHELKYQPTGTTIDYFHRAKATWPSNQMQRLHLSSPRDGFVSISKARPHSDYINPADIPDWLWEMDVLVDIEAKKKELAIGELQKINIERSRGSKPT